MKKERVQLRIRYDENWNGKGEFYVFECRRSNEDEWGLDTAFKLMDKDDIKGILINYQALTKIRECMKNGVEIIWE